MHTYKTGVGGVAHNLQYLGLGERVWGAAKAGMQLERRHVLPRQPCTAVLPRQLPGSCQQQAAGSCTQKLLPATSKSSWLGLAWPMARL